MTYHFPVSTLLYGTNVSEPADYFENDVQRSFAKEDIRLFEKDVFINASGEIITVSDYDANKTYQKGDISFKDGYIEKYSDYQGNVPKQPQNYTSYATGNLDMATIADRYVKVMEYADWTDGAGGSFNYTSGYEIHSYAILKVSGKWTFRTYYENADTGNNRVAVNQDVDVLSEISISTAERAASQAFSSGSTQIYGWVANTIIVNTSGVFVRSMSNASQEFTTASSMVWEKVNSPEEIGFSYLRPRNSSAPFDDKQYTSVVTKYNQTWTVQSENYFNSICFGRIRGSTVSVVFKDSNDNVVSSVTDKSIPCTVDLNVESVPTSDIIYASRVIGPFGKVDITITGDEVEIGTIFLGYYIDAGMTNLDMTHEIQSFDRTKISPISGYEEYIRGQRKIIYTGSFDTPMIGYDRTILLTRYMVNELVAIDGSDTVNNEASDGKSYFQATKIIGRIKRLSQKTNIESGDLDAVLTTEFRMEEIV